ncbi:MAG: NrsF family protein [Acidobacteriota bacterium]
MTVRTDDLIAALARGLTPVVPVATVRVRLARWTGAALVTLAAAVWVVGARGDWPAAIGEWPVQAHSLLLVIAGVFGALAALHLAVPGERRGWSQAWAVCAALAWLAWLGGELALAAGTGEAAWRVGVSWSCAFKVIAAGLVPAVVLLVMVRRSAPLAPRAAAALAVLSAASIGALGAEWMCPNTRPMHLLVWHALPVVAATGFALLIGASIVSARAAGDDVDLSG